MWFIVGLGNPGEKYEATRHNLGFMVVDECVAGSKYQVVWEDSKKFKSWIAKTNDLIFTKPQTYMNNSGLAVKLLTTYYKLLTTDVIIVHDDIDLPLGKIKIRLGGSAGGHHGVESVINSLSNDKFVRVRLGIGTLHSQRSERDRQHTDTERFVLEPFASSEKAKVKQLVKHGAKALELIITEGLAAAQNRYH